MTTFRETMQKYEDYHKIVWICWAVGIVAWLIPTFWIINAYHVDGFAALLLAFPYTAVVTGMTGFWLKHHYDAKREEKKEGQN